MIINGKLNENLSALFIKSDNISTNITARLILNQKDGNEISLHDVKEDLLILVSIKDKKPIVSCWQTDYRNRNKYGKHQH